MSIDSYVARYRPLLEAGLRDALACRNSLTEYYGMMQYHMGWRDADLLPAQHSVGKQLRPVLCLLACEAVGGEIDQALPAAVTIELLHNFSLIHDDIEDASSMRRHRTTVWKLWGAAHGINCGDGMFAIAFQVLGKLVEQGVSPGRALQAQRVVAQTCLSLTEGQYLDMSFEERTDVALDEYLTMICNKTAALVACSTGVGALLGGGGDEEVVAYRKFGKHLGLAFQVIDDILGVWGREDDTGKSVSSDILAKKKTLPIVHAWADSELRVVYAQETLTEDDVAHVVSVLDRCHAREHAEQMALRYSEQAMDWLERAGQETPVRRAIKEYTLALLGRVS
jgi:geranylgeranyl diphosphate synthase type I